MNDRRDKIILLVEDDALLALVEQRILEDYGYKVVIMASGEKALDYLAGGGRSDLVLMDIDLGPGMDGTEAAQAILRNHRLPIVFLSSHTEPEIVAKTEGITSYGYVVKSSLGTVLNASLKMAFRLFEADRLLAASEAKQRALISNIADVIAIVGVDARVKYVSPNIERLFGWRPEELEAREVWHVLDPLDAPRVQAAFHELLLRPAASINLEFGYLGKDGKSRPVELIATNLCQDPVIGGVLINYHEISQRREAEERLRNVVAGTNAGTWEWNIQTGEASIDETSLGFLGYTREDLLPFSFSKWMDLKHPLDKGENAEQLRRHIEGATDFYSFESRMRHKDGHWVWILGRGKLIERDPEGKPLRMFGTHLDISERMEAEEALRESESRLSRAEGLAGMGNWKFFLSSQEMEFSKGMARIFGVAPGRISFAQVREIDLPEYHGLLAKAQEDLIERGIPYNIEFRIRRPTDGAVIDLHSVADYDRESNIIFGVVEDITEMKKTEGRIKDLLAEKELILREVQHRIKNNMATMVSLLSLQSGVVTDEAAAMALKDAESRLRSMGVLYDKLYRSEGLQAMSIKDYLPSLVEEIVAEFPSPFRVSIEAKVEDLPLGVKELSTLGILVNEVVTNSMKYAFVGRDRGQISLHVEREGSSILIVIADDGVGLPAGINLENPQGFGLLLVKSLARQLGACIQVDTCQGTRLSLRMPASV